MFGAVAVGLGEQQQPESDTLLMRPGCSPERRRSSIAWELWILAQASLLLQCDEESGWQSPTRDDAGCCWPLELQQTAACCRVAHIVLSCSPPGMVHRRMHIVCYHMAAGKALLLVLLVLDRSFEQVQSHAVR